MSKRTNDCRLSITASVSEDEVFDADDDKSERVVDQDYEGQFGFRHAPVIEDDSLDAIDPKIFDRTFKRKTLTAVFKV